jgi:hypothetical protein
MEKIYVKATSEAYIPQVYVCAWLLASFKSLQRGFEKNPNDRRRVYHPQNLKAGIPPKNAVQTTMS